MNKELYLQAKEMVESEAAASNVPLTEEQKEEAKAAENALLDSIAKKGSNSVSLSLSSWPRYSGSIRGSDRHFSDDIVWHFENFPSLILCLCCSITMPMLPRTFQLRAPSTSRKMARSTVATPS